MSPAEITQLILAAATLVSAVGALMIGLRNSVKIEQVHIATNSMKDELVAVTRSDAKQIGVAEGLKQARDAGR